jgi:lysophospholipase L1-like esterase
VRFIGRVDTSDAAGPRFAWSGTGVVARFSGSELAVRMNGGQQYTVLIDGELQPKLTTTGGADALASGLAEGEHRVEIYRRTEANQGESQFLGFELGAGQLLPPPAALDRRIEIIGDSISAGYGNEGADMSCPFSPDTENHYLTYGAIAARNVGAELVTVAWSGKGVVCNYGDDATSCMDPMPLYYGRTLPNRADSTWDFSRFQPQAVVINLGTNDMSTMTDPSEPEFTTAYVDLLTRVRTAYPDALILCTVGPLLNGTDLTSTRTYISAAVQQRVGAGDADVRTFELAPTNPSDGYGCDYHPSLRTHEIMADVLTSTLEAELGW